MNNGSGLRVNSFLKVYIDVANYEPINEGGYIEKLGNSKPNRQ